MPIFLDLPVLSFVLYRTVSLQIIAVVFSSEIVDCVQLNSLARLKVKYIVVVRPDESPCINTTK